MICDERFERGFSSVKGRQRSLHRCLRFRRTVLIVRIE